jgi:competence protein ComEC
MVVHKTFLTIISLLIITLLSFIAFWPDNKVHLIACDVGQGDAILITHGFDQVLIDGGPNDKVLGCLARHMPFWDRDVEMVVNTHPDADHLKGLLGVLERYQVKQIISNSLYDSTDLFEQFHDLIMSKNIKVYSPKEGDRLKINNIEFEVLWPDQVMGNLALWKNPLPGKQAVLGESSPKPKFNESAVVFLMRYKQFKALLTADITQQAEDQIINFCSGRDCQTPVDVLKVAHHGSKTSTSQEFLEFFRPKIAIISVGQNNQWGHPNQEVLDRLVAIGAKIRRTDLSGDIEIKTDGKKTQERTTSLN